MGVKNWDKPNVQRVSRRAAQKKTKAEGKIKPLDEKTFLT
jgi:hypothetical protein